jgi:serine phosphatase RsbU (regulator of sigma subunit)
VSLQLINETTTELEIRAWRGLSEEHIQESRLHLGEGITGRVAADGVMRTSRDIQADPIYRLSSTAQKEGLHSMLSMPITVRQQVIGVINLFTREIRNFEEREITLVSTIASMAGTAIRNATVYERERHIAETLQTSLLPARIPDFNSIQIGYRYEPAAAEARVGGDFYDFFLLPNNTWGFMVGDVSGHGVGAAVNTALVKYAIRAYAYENADPGTVLTKVNDAVSRQMELGTFITVLYAVLDPAKRHFRITNGGHPFAVHFIEENQKCSLMEPGGMAVGIVPDQEYLEEDITLKPGDIMALFTDGVTEAGPRDEMLGVEGVMNLIETYHHLEPQEIADRIYQHILQISHGITTDDVALLILKAV